MKKSTIIMLDDKLLKVLIIDNVGIIIYRNVKEASSIRNVPMNNLDR